MAAMAGRSTGSLAVMLEVVPLEKNKDGFEFAFAVKKEALGPYVVSRWGWNEELQRKTHAERWTARRFFRIVRDGASVGTVSIDEAADHLMLAEFYILPPFQRQGIGTEVLRRILSEAQAKRLPVRLQFLKWNPVASLYKRHGFAVTGETETHFVMERAA